MKLITLILGILFVLSLILFFITYLGLFKTLSISFGTCFYHFIMRLIVGTFYQIKFDNQINYKHKWFKAKKFEASIYKKLKVKTWKKHLPTYNVASFNIKNKSYEQIVMVMCQAELVHETIVIFSFLPIVFSIFFGQIFVFIITSLLSAIIDVLFVIMQRYNRPRFLRKLSKDN